MSFTIGCDPEFFLLKKGKPHSAIGLVGGTKKNPNHCVSEASQFKKIM